LELISDQIDEPMRLLPLPCQFPSMIDLLSVAPLFLFVSLLLAFLIVEHLEKSNTELTEKIPLTFCIRKIILVFL
jgi:hypothetical protein